MLRIKAVWCSRTKRFSCSPGRQIRVLVLQLLGGDKGHLPPSSTSSWGYCHFSSSRVPQMAVTMRRTVSSR